MFQMYSKVVQLYILYIVYIVHINMILLYLVYDILYIYITNNIVICNNK